MPQTQQPQVDGSQKNPQQQVYQQQQQQRQNQQQQQYQRAPTKVKNFSGFQLIKFSHTFTPFSRI